MSSFHFPRWTNHFRLLIPAGAIGGVLYAVVFVWVGFSPKTIAGYAPEQPIPFSHALHAGELGSTAATATTPWRMRVTRRSRRRRRA